MDGVSVAASIVGIATAGVQVSIKLVNLATQVKTASDRVSSIANDISLTSGVLHQLGELMNQKTTDGGISILSQHGLETTKRSAAMCERIFQEIEKETKKASVQLRNFKPGRGRMSGEKIELMMFEKARWPFLQPNIDILRVNLRDAKSTLMLMLQVMSLALNKRVFEASLSTSEHEDYVRTIVALELRRREEQKDPTEQQEGSEPSGSNFAPNSGNANTVSSEMGMWTFVDNPQPSSSWGKASRNHTARANTSRQSSSDRYLKSSRDTSSSPGPDRSSVDSRGSKLPRLNRDNNVPGIRTAGSANLPPSSNSGNETRTHPSTELHLLLLKPEVIDFSNKIELYWSIKDAKMQQFAIHEHMTKNKQDGLPSVVDMLQQLRTYEQSMVNSETSKVDGGSVLSLKRTKTDIRCRDMLFEAVPGLQFVIQRRIRQPGHGYADAPPRHNYDPPGHGYIPQRHGYTPPLYCNPSQVPDALPLPSSGPGGPGHAPPGPSYGLPQQQYPAQQQYPPQQSSKVFETLFAQSAPPYPLKLEANEAFDSAQFSCDLPPDYLEDSQEDQEAEDLVTELLAKYTILSP